MSLKKQLLKSKNYVKHMGPESKFVSGIKGRLDILTLGSTYAYYDVDFSASNYNTFNAALPPQTLHYDARILNQFISSIKKEAIVNICLVPYSFCVDEYSDSKKSFVYYYFLDKHRISHYSFSRKIYALLLPIKHAILSSVKHAVFLKKSSLKTVINEDLPDKSNVLSNTAQDRIRGWCEEFEVHSLSEVAENTILCQKMQRVVGILDSMITTCLENDLIPIITILPVSKQLERLLPADLVSTCLLNNIEKANRGRAEILNYYNNEQLQNEAYFETADCLNHKGRQIFSQILLDDLLNIKNHFCKGGNKSNDKTLVLFNGITLPRLGFGTGVVRKYSRNKLLFLKSNLRPILSSIKRLRLNKNIWKEVYAKVIVQKALDGGFRLLDTGRIYGYSEKVIGEVLKKKERKHYFICTKVSDMDITRKQSPNSVLGNFKNSLYYLNTDYVDAYLLHWPHGEWIEIYKEIEKIYQSGKAKSIGVCNFSVENFKELFSYCTVKPHLCQTELHPLNTKRELRAFCKTHEIVIMAHTPTGRVCEKIANSNILIKMAANHKKSIAQIILRWHLQNGIIPIVATSSEKHINENQNIYDFYLSDNEMMEIETMNEDYVLLPGNGIDDPNYVYNL